LYLPFGFLAFLYVLILFESGFRAHGKLTKKAPVFVRFAEGAFQSQKMFRKSLGIDRCTTKP